MTRSPTSRYDLSWRRENLAALLALCALWAGILSLHLSAGRVWFGDDPPVIAARVHWASERIDPNTAAAASLRRLPGIGPVLANAIVRYRQQHRPRAFRTPNDLADVKGIGPATVDRIRPFLSIGAGELR